MFKKSVAALVALLLAGQAALADTSSAPPGPLAPGAPAGIHEAQSLGPDANKLAIAAVAVVGAAGIYFVLGTHYSNYRRPNNPATITTGR